MYPRMDTKTERRCVALYEAGLSLRQVGARTGLSPQGVVRALRRNDIVRRPMGQQVKVPSVAKCFALYRELGTWRAVAAAVGVHERSLYRYMRGGR